MDIIEPVLRRRAGRLRLPPRLAGIADRLPAAAAAHAEGRLLRHAPHARAGQEAPRPLPDRLDQRGLRRPAGAPAAGDLLGPRQPDRPARRLRRGQALRRGADDGLPPPAGRRHRDRPDLQHLRAADARRTTAARSRRSCARRSRAGRSPCSATGRQTRSFCYVDDLVRGIIALAESGHHDPVNIGNPNEFTLLELAETVIAITGSSSEIVYEALPTDDPQVRQPDIALARELLGWEPEVELREGLRADDRGVRARTRSSGRSRRRAAAEASFAPAALAPPRDQPATSTAQLPLQGIVTGSAIARFERHQTETPATPNHVEPVRDPRRGAAHPACARRAPQAAARAVVAAPARDAAPDRARRCRCSRSTGSASPARS